MKSIWCNFLFIILKMCSTEAAIFYHELTDFFNSQRNEKKQIKKKKKQNP